MEKSMLFPKLNGFAHGGDYNPEQWLDRPDILELDIKMMKKAGINCVTLGVFSWSVYEPKEGEFHYQWLLDIMNRLYEEGIYIVLATPSGARPAWLDEAYPEAMRVSKQGVRNHHGVRHNHCISSPIYREKVAQIDRKIAAHLGGHPSVLIYHISNELGGECYCPHCVSKFREYLKEQFNNSIDALNKAWWTTFWSHTYQSFEQIEPPFSNGEGSIMGLNLEWKRFTTWNMNDFMKAEIQALREITPHIPVTCNFMTLYNGLDYRKMAGELDVISWDSYPKFHNDYESLYETMAENAFHNTVMRSMKKEKPFMLMESAPGLVNWHPFNKLKRPGVHKLFCLQTIACGSDTIQYFQWRKGRGSFEQYHGAVVDHLGTDDTRIFKEVEEVGEILNTIREAAGTCVKAKTALLFDWDNRWAIQDVKALSDSTKKYEETCMGLWKEFHAMGVEMDIIPSDGDFSDYKVIVAPMLYVLQPNTASNLKKFVENGGQLLTTYFTGYVDKDLLCHLGGFPGDGLSQLFGVISEEIDTLYPSDCNFLQFTKDFLKEAAIPLIWEVKEYAEVLRVIDAKVLATYTGDYYKGRAGLTKKKYGKGNAYYIAARVSPREMIPLLKEMVREAGIPVKDLYRQVEYHKREGEAGTYEFYLNHGTEKVFLEGVEGVEILSSKEIRGSLELEGYGVAVIRNKNTC